MKIAFIVPSFPSVSETFILRQIVGLIKRGHEVDVEAWLPGDSSTVHGDVDRFNLLAHTRYRFSMPAAWLPRLRSGVSRLVQSGWRRPLMALDSVNIVRHGRAAMNLSLVHNSFPDNSRREYDVIHCHFGPNGERALALRKAGNIRGPIVTTFYGYDANALPRIQGPELYKDLFRHGDLFTVGSEFLRRRIISLGAPENRILKLRMGADVALYEFVGRRSAPDGEFRLLTIARLVEVKGVEYVIRAVALLKDEHLSLRYQIAGNGPLLQSLERLTRELSISDRVEFLGAITQEESLRLYKKANAFVLPSIVTEGGEEEGQPIVLAEAQAAGLPVIASAIGGIPESILDGESGLLVPPRNPEALARAIAWLVDHPSSCETMGRAGRAYVEEHFNNEREHDRLVDMYRSVLAPES